MRVLTAILLIFNLWTSAAHAQDGQVRWLNSSIDCSSDRYPYYTNPFNVYEQTSKVLKKRRPDGVLFFSVNIVFGFCSPSEKTFVAQEGRMLTVISTEKWPWQKIPWLVDVKAYLQQNIEGQSYNKLEIRVDEKLLSLELQNKNQVSVNVAYHDFNINGVRVKWIFENSNSGIKARIQDIR